MAPEDFAYFVNYLHKNKIGIILDWVPRISREMSRGWQRLTEHRTCLYEYADPRKGEHRTGEPRYLIMAK